MNSGFYYLSEDFLHERLERMMRDQLFDSQRPYNTDQKIRAFLYPDMGYYHPEDLKRSRRSIGYDLETETAAALHFLGRMWQNHLDQIERRASPASSELMHLRFEEPVPLSLTELLRMRAMLKVAESTALRTPVELFRKARKLITS